MIEWLAQYKDAAPAIGTIIALISAGVAWFAFKHTRAVSRRRATLDMVLKTFVDEDGQKRYIAFKEVMARHNDPADPLDILAFADPGCAPSDDRQTVRAQLNEYELISLGIRRKLFDEKLYKLWFQDQFQRDYRSLEPFISKVREQRAELVVTGNALELAARRDVVSLDATATRANRFAFRLRPAQFAKRAIGRFLAHAENRLEGEGASLCGEEKVLGHVIVSSAYALCMMTPCTVVNDKRIAYDDISHHRSRQCRLQRKNGKIA